MSVETSKSSGALAVATTVVCARPCKISSIMISPAAAASSVTVYDNASTAAGTIVALVNVAASTATTSVNMVLPVECLNGCTAVVAGAGATAYIHFSMM